MSQKPKTKSPKNFSNISSRGSRIPTKFPNLSSSRSPKSDFKINHNILFSPRHYRLFTLGLFAFLLAFLASAALTPVSSSSAQTLQYDLNPDTGYYVQVTGSSNLNVTDVRPTVSGALASIKDTINVETNSPFGFRLVLSAASANMYNDIDTEKAGNHLSPVSGSLSTPATLGLNTWGFALNKTNTVTASYAENFETANAYNPNGLDQDVPETTSTWAAVPESTDPLEIASLDTYNHATNGSDLDIYYGINASTDLPSGTYSNIITYTAYSEGANLGLPTMQDFTQAQCEAMLEDTSTRLMDTRDQKVYRVTKMKDGNCWMTQNLAIGPKDTSTDLVLTPADSNVVTTRTIPGSSLIDGNGTTPSTYDTPQIVATFQNTTDDYGSYYGNYYNWNAATAGVGKQATTGTVYESICPRGWRLPDNSTWSETDAAGNKIKSYVNLIGNYTVNVDGTGDQMPTTNTTNAAAVSRIQQSPLYFPPVGWYNSGIRYQGALGFWWSRTVDDSNSDGVYANNLSFNISHSEFYLQGFNNKHIADPIRCVFGENTANYMQNFTTEMCNNLTQATNGLTEDVRKALMDSRDGKLYNVSRMADNNCWMVSNLALDGIDSSTGKGRVLTTADTNIDAAEVGSDSVTFPDTTDITSGTSVYTPPQIYTLSQNKTTTNCSSYPDTCVISDVAYGNYYNWHAATAMQGDENTTSATTIKSSVCPKGWRLPDNGTTEDAKTYSNLVKNYTINVDGSGDPMPTTNTTNAAAVKRIQQIPLYFPLAGSYSSGFYAQGIHGLYWSRTTAGSATNAYSLYFYASDSYFNPLAHGDKSRGRSVRCVLGE